MIHAVRPIAVLALSLVPLAGQAAADPFTTLSFAEAQAQASAKGRRLVVEFSPPGIEPCRRLAATTWKDPGVLEWLAAHAMAVRVDPEVQTQLALEHRIDAYPTVLVLERDGTEALRVVGYHNGPGMVARFVAAEEASSTDYKVRMRLADGLVATGDLSGALQHYLWCWDHGLEHDKAMTGVRVSFLLAKIDELAKGHPPARAALAERRDAAEQQVLAGDLGLQTVTDMVRLNEVLGTRARSLAVLEKVPAARWKSKDVARRVLFESALPVLLEAKRYGDVLALGGDPMRELDRELSFLKLPGMPADFLARQGQRLVEKYAAMVEAYFGTREEKAAIALGDRLLEVQEGTATWCLLIDAAKRAGNDVQGHELVVRALATLPPEEHAVIRQRLQRK